MIRKIFDRLLPPAERLDEAAVDSLLADSSLLFLAQNMQNIPASAERPGSEELGRLVVECANAAAELRRVYELSPDQMGLALAAAQPVWLEGEL
jgi:hypothetical protein